MPRDMRGKKTFFSARTWSGAVFQKAQRNKTTLSNHCSSHYFCWYFALLETAFDPTLSTCVKEKTSSCEGIPKKKKKVTIISDEWRDVRNGSEFLSKALVDMTWFVRTILSYFAEGMADHHHHC